MEGFNSSTEQKLYEAMLCLVGNASDDYPLRKRLALAGGTLVTLGERATVSKQGDGSKMAGYFGRLAMRSGASACR